MGSATTAASPFRGGVGDESRKTEIMAGGSDQLEEARHSQLGQVLEIIQMSFRDGRLPMDCEWHTVVLLPKGNGDFQGVGIVKVLWKELLGLVNC